jgi:hypothetical protein
MLVFAAMFGSCARAHVAVAVVVTTASCERVCSCVIGYKTPSDGPAISLSACFTIMARSQQRAHRVYGEVSMLERKQALGLGVSDLVTWLLMGEF